MAYPTIYEAEELLKEAEKLNPGDWVLHNRVAAKCAREIAANCKNIDTHKAYVLGLLHDIGRITGVCDLKHTIAGYKYMLDKGYGYSARICLTHSFPYKNVDSYNGYNDCNDEETTFIQDYINETNYDDYDRLIQLCDAISYPTGPCHIEKRLVDVVMRRGFNELTIMKWKEYFKLKEYFEGKMGLSLETLWYKLDMK